MTNQSFAGKRSFRTILAVVIVLTILLTIFAGTAYASASDEYKVNIVDGTNTIAISTTETEPIEILKSAGITLSTSDKLDISAFTESEGGSIVINRLNTVYIEFDNNITSYTVYANTVKDALDEIGVSVKSDDKINYSLDAKVTDGMVITITNTEYVTLKADGTKTKYAITSGTVADLIASVGIVLDEDDYTEPSLDTKLKKDLVIKVMRVEIKSETKTEKIPFSTKETKDKTLAKGKTKTVVEGKKGEAEVTYDVKYVNGKEDSRKETSRVVTKEAVEAEVIVGTKKVAEDTEVKENGVKSKNGYSVGQKIDGRYSHYCACATCNGNSRGITTSGKKIKNGMKDPHYIACNWLPLGSVISVDGTNYTVVDRGGSGLSRRGRIDIFTPGGHKECYKLGVGSCSIEIIRLGW